MKKYLVFIGSFALFLILFEILSGLLLTAFYTPNVPSINSYQQEVSFGIDTGYPYLIILLTASLAYYFSQKLGKAFNKKG
ncbi:hypothetical protein [Metabacillus niabensis]|uniref:Quinol-cytochrome oxidoreductase complex cytochrome b subunit n=1 Tax=Metabacillus niabensis TaxID=324854 RepID=A0ABT9Z4U8_9BACI|nr:hypothetical protein [Metabacillus niabensis]MDQ0227294.1 quinol-cytochrome oxidoreductase complex cytochrome b subunit [Metabacillus niabensis]